MIVNAFPRRLRVILTESILLLVLEVEPELGKGKDLTPPKGSKVDLAWRMMEENCDFVP